MPFTPLQITLSCQLQKKLEDIERQFDTQLDSFLTTQCWSILLFKGGVYLLEVLFYFAKYMHLTCSIDKKHYREV